MSAFKHYSHPPKGFSYVAETPDETAEYRRTHNNHHPAVYRVECNDCHKRLWGSGLGVGSHRRACPGPPK